MKTSLSINLLCGLLLASIGMPNSATAAPAVAEDSVSVEAASGRTFTGQLDARSDADRLWLRSRRGSACVLRPIDWDRVVRVRVADQDLSAEEFRSIVEAVQREASAGEEPVATPHTIVIQGSASRGGSSSAAAMPPHRQDATPRVRSLAIEAVAANFDGDVEVDGLLVYVYPLDDSGAVVEVRGTLRFDLIGVQNGPNSRWRPLKSVGRWSRQVRTQDFGPQGAVYRLPYRGIHPEFDLELGAYGSLHARLSVPGQGTFETTEGVVRLRPYSAVRDRLQLTRGRRFLPQERTGDGRR